MENKSSWSKQKTIRQNGFQSLGSCAVWKTYCFEVFHSKYCFLSFPGPLLLWLGYCVHAQRHPQGNALLCHSSLFPLSWFFLFFFVLFILRFFCCWNILNLFFFFAFSLFICQLCLRFQEWPTTWRLEVFCFLEFRPIILRLSLIMKIIIKEPFTWKKKMAKLNEFSRFSLAVCCSVRAINKIIALKTH